ncbi:MAG: competence/damage-inducible protein A [Phycisphaeraceae bacterium]
MQALILSIGDELVLGQTLDTNCAYLAEQLAGRGIMSRYHLTIADDEASIADSLKWAAMQAELVIVTGGLGPTEDDLTRQAMAKAMGVELAIDEASIEGITSYFKARGREMPQRNKVQAMLPRGAEAIVNTCGTAPGIKATIGSATFFITPGVPNEMVAMFQHTIFPWLDAQVGSADGKRRTILTEKINTFGAGESDVAGRLGLLMDRKRNPLVGTTVADGIVSVRVRSEFDDAAKAASELAATLSEIEARLGSIVTGRGSDTLQLSLVKLLREMGVKVATAESCTGGLAGKMITDVAGSSDIYAGGWITYSNAMKTVQLEVPDELIQQHGAVSEPVARALAQGALRRSEADLAVGITGIAGPGGGTPAKPVGTVWIAIAFYEEGTGAMDSDARLFLLPGDREAVRDRAAKCALAMLRFHVMGVPLDELKWARTAAVTG